MSPEEKKFAGVASLLGNENLEALKSAHFLIIGLGGVGTWTVESLARSGVGAMTLVDLDDICVSNTNRQLHAHEGNYGKFKAEALQERIHSINPNCQVNVELSYFNQKSIDRIFSQKYDMVIDAIDSVDDKCLLLDYCYKNQQKVVTVGGAAGKQDPTLVTIAELAKTKNDMLLRGVRKRLKRDYRYPLGRGKAKVKCVFSTELAPKLEVCDLPASGQNVKLDCEGGLGTTTYMTGTFGFLLSYIAIKEFLAQVN